MGTEPIAQSGLDTGGLFLLGCPAARCHLGLALCCEKSSGCRVTHEYSYRIDNPNALSKRGGNYCRLR
jgi:hypothetical protein